VLSIGAQLTDVLQAHRGGHGTPRPAANRATELLDMVGNHRGPARQLPARSCPAGCGKRVMIAMALALEPQVVILDEPTTALDVVTQREILEELTALA